MSLGAKGNIATSPVCLAIKDITDAGTIVVAAAGNSNIDTSRFVPGGCSESITVGAVDENNTRATFSNYGEKVDVAAPGVGIYSTYLHDGYKSLNGTSMATPHIVGIVSILKTFQPELTTHEIKELLKNNALPVQTEDNKKIASQVDLEKILTSFGLNPSQKIENEILEAKKEIEEIPKENQPEVSTQTGSEKQSESSGPENTQETFILEDNALIDESVGLVIQNTEEETTKINSAENEQQDLVSDENNESSSQINDINLNGGESQTEQIEINNIEEETIQDVLEENSSEELEESDITGIQNSYTCSFNIGGSCSLSLANANNKNIYNYSAKTSGLTYSTNSSKLTIYGNKVGTINFYVNKYNTSKRKYELLHTIVVTVTDPIKILKATMGTTTFQKNESTSINVTSGNGGYSVTSSNTSVAQISGSNTSWIVKGVGIGNTTITIKDSKGKSGTWNITVTPRNLTLSTYSLDVDKGVNGIINITDGNGGYSIVKKNNDISVNLSGTRITVYSTVIGSHTLQVRDSVGKVVSLSVKILSPLVVNGFNQSIQKYVGESISYTVNSGNGGYSVNSSNTNVASVSANYGGTNGVITAKGVGNATITLKDGSGKSVSIYLYVNAKVNIIDTQYTPTVEEGYVGGIYFKVDNPSGVKEAGVQYYNNTINSTPSSSSWKTQTIPNQGDGEFAGFILPKTKYTNVRGYVITTGGETIYTSAYTITYGGSSLYAYYNGGGTSIANVEENGDYSDESSEENIGENSESEYSEGETNEEGVEVNSIGAFIGVGIFVAGVGLTAYTCEQDGWTSSSCLVGGALTFIPVGKIAGFAGKFIPKQAVVNYFSSTALGRLSTTLGKYVDDVARLGVNGKLLVNILNNITNISTKISNGHAFSKHISEFKSLGITTNEQLKSHIEKVIKNATNTNLKVGSNSRVAFCDNKTSTIVIYDKNSVDLGTVFIPTEGKTYFNNFK